MTSIKEQEDLVSSLAKQVARERERVEQAQQHMAAVILRKYKAERELWEMQQVERTRSV